MIVEAAEVKGALGFGFVSGFLGSLCCITPLVLVLLGLSGLTGAMALATTLQQNFRFTVFIPLAAIFLIGSIYFHIKKKDGVCNLEAIKHHKLYVIVTVSFAISMWVLLIYVFIPGAFGLLS